MRRRVRLTGLAALTVVLSAGCGDTATKAPAAGASASASATATPVAAGPPWHDDVAPATAAGKVGAAGTPCELPIAFSLPANWKAKPVNATGDLAELARMGGATMRCEIDAKPAGNIGFLRVWTIDRGAVVGTRKGLEEFLAEYGKVTEVQYRDAKAGPFAATEVTFQKESELTGDATPGRALAVGTRQGTMMITLGGMDAEEFTAMFPAYQLAKQTVTLTF